ncbi:MAG: type II CRISPR RNA-guided endonuclease Cas9, partial [Oscillospiraceae bacterium]|nr:type II CRISPR RNA-guided endonuclease Cas9 [Oscillospiraceae bacterium]
GGEWARVLIHLAQRRGFKSNRKGESVGKEDGLILAAVKENRERMTANGYRSVAEMLLRDQVYKESKRNKGGNYNGTVYRDMVEAEIRLLFATQRDLGNLHTSKELEEEYVTIWGSQRSFDEGPDESSPYGGDQIAKRIGKCTLCPEEKRAPRAAYSFEYFSLLQKINHIRLLRGGESRPLTGDERHKLIELCHSKASPSYADIRKALGIVPDERFNDIRCKDDDREAAEKKEKFVQFKAYHEMRKALDKVKKGRINDLSITERDEIAYALTVYRTEKKLCAALDAAGITPLDRDELMKLPGFTKFGHLSIKACTELIPHLEQGLVYNEACAAAGYDFRARGGEKSVCLHPTPEDYEPLTSPVVRRSISQTVKVLNAIIRERGESPTYVHIELAREMSKPKKERDEIEKTQKKRRDENEALLEKIRSEGRILSPGGQELVRLRLWKEQDGRSPYTGAVIEYGRLFEPGYAEIDHIIPCSRSMDDSNANKVLVLTAENRDKRNRLPMEYLSGKAREDFIVRVSAMYKDPRKRRNLLRESFTRDEAKDFRDRNLNDTKTATVFMKNYIQDHLLFAPSDRYGKKPVMAVNGVITDKLRQRWGLNKVRADGDRHHALDAVVIACTTDGMIQEISRHAEYRECEYMQLEDGSYAVDKRTGEMLRRFPKPWHRFDDEVRARLSDDPIRSLRDQNLREALERAEIIPRLVSHMPRRKLSGPAHKETIRSPKTIDGVKHTVSRTALTALKLKNGAIEGYDRNLDPVLYDALLERLQKYGGDGKKAFAEPFFRPQPDGAPGPRVKAVKLTDKATLTVDVHGGKGVADNDTLLRIDVFYVEDDGYYFVPLYVADAKKKELPGKACVAHKPYEQWKDMKEEDFVFSLWPYDLIKLTLRGNMNMDVAQKESTLPDKKAV